MVWGRWSIALTLRALPTISEGLAKEVHRRSGTLPLLHATLWLVVINGFSWYQGTTGLLRAATASLAATVLWTIYLRRRVGGHSGDLLGAGNQLVEAAALLAAMLRWPF
jgi:adenosylcobinamide-GDP ribazoletransferase